MSPGRASPLVIQPVNVNPPILATLVERDVERPVGIDDLNGKGNGEPGRRDRGRGGRGAQRPEHCPDSIHRFRQGD